MNLEDEIRSALRRKEPSPEFTERVLARAYGAPVRRAPRPWARWVAAMAASVLLAAGAIGYREYRGERARSQVLLALRIAGGKLNKAQKKVHMLNAAHRNNS
jgi:negative regulator of sigma E activity